MLFDLRPLIAEAFQPRRYSKLTALNARSTFVNNPWADQVICPYNLQSILSNKTADYMNPKTTYLWGR